MDVKKLGKIPDGGGWKALGRQDGHHDRKIKIGYDYVHSLIDDHSRLAYSESLDDEKGPTCAAFLNRAIGYFADHRLIAHSPTTAVSRPRPNTTEVRFLSLDIDALALALRNEAPFDLFVRLAGIAGLRARGDGRTAHPRRRRAPGRGSGAADDVPYEVSPASVTATACLPIDRSDSLMALLSGARDGEVCALRRTDVDLEAGRPAHDLVDDGEGGLQARRRLR